MLRDSRLKLYLSFHYEIEVLGRLFYLVYQIAFLIPLYMKKRRIILVNIVQLLKNSQVFNKGFLFICCHNAVPFYHAEFIVWVLYLQDKGVFAHKQCFMIILF